MPVTTGQLTIQLLAVVENPQVSAIQIVASSGSSLSVSVAPPSVTLSASGTQQLTAVVSGSSNQNVTWSLSPSVGTLVAGLYQAPSSIATQQTVTVKATSVVDNATFGTATVTLLPSGAFAPIRVNAGAGSYSDSQGQTWSADFGYVGGGATYSTANAISGTSDPALYQTERYNYGTLQYGFAVPNGSYTVTLKFAEIYFNNAGQRVFNIVLNGTTVASNFDVVAQAGGSYRAVDRSFTVPVTTGQLTIQLLAVVENPQVSAIQIVASSGSSLSVSVAPPSVTLSASGTQQFTATVTGNSNQNVTWSLFLGRDPRRRPLPGPESVATQQTVTVKATSAVDNATFGTATVTLLPSGAFAPIRVNAGAGSYSDSQGQTWSADFGYVGGGATYSTANAIAGTSDPALYQTERYDYGTLQYGFAVPNGSYTVTLKFAEIYFNNAGQRIFNIVLNGTTVASNFDVVAQAGGSYKAVDRSFTVPVTTGQLTIQLVAVVQNPQVSAIQITSP